MCGDERLPGPGKLPDTAAFKTGSIRQHFPYLVHEFRFADMRLPEQQASIWRSPDRNARSE